MKTEIKKPYYETDMSHDQGRYRGYGISHQHQTNCHPIDRLFFSSCRELYPLASTVGPYHIDDFKNSLKPSTFFFSLCFSIFLNKKNQYIFLFFPRPILQNCRGQLIKRVSDVGRTLRRYYRFRMKLKEQCTIQNVQCALHNAKCTKHNA